MTLAESSPRPLDGVQVLDLSRVLAGPFAAQMLGDLGATVIKVERPGAGDDARKYGPGFLEAPDNTGQRQSAFYLSTNRNKKSITIDMGKSGGQRLVRELVSRCDVLIENFKFGTLTRYGLDFETLSAINPRLVYCSITAFGQTGPYRNRPGYDGIFQAGSGLMSVTGLPDDQPGGGPMKVGPSIVDVLTGYNAAIAILAALRHRDQVSGKGQHIDLALFDTAVAAASHYPTDYLVTGNVPVRKGTEGNGGMPAGVFDCADRPIMLAVGNDEQFARFCEVIDRPDLVADKRYASVPQRSDNRRPLVSAIQQSLSCWNSGELLEMLEKAGVPAGPVNDYSEVFGDPHSLARGLTVRTSHPYRADLQLIANPIRFSETPVETYRAPPLLGENTDEILSGLLGFDAETIEALKRDAII
ncbi:MAG: CoA transferase [Sphingomonas sp.]|nr:CoA transferase [Sphingomonas sp.]